ncbi:MAG TPA: prolyl oligopeptidase family serine peptidase [Planctomycetota bacterium]|nr:prolyl oligopeptidase family serine peptidase [Planctomycetota bacterium]
MPDLHVVTDRTYGPHPRQQFDVFIPEGADNCATVVCVHGGWFSAGHHHDLRSLAFVLAERGYACAPISIRHLADVRGGADLVDDVCIAARKALEESSLLGGSPRTLVLLGSGSGSLPALAAAQRLGEDRKLRVRAAIACGVTPSADAWDGCPPAIARVVQQYGAGHADALGPMTMPADRFPPLLLLHGDQDAEVPAKLAHKLHMRVIEAGEDSQLAVLAGVGHHFIDSAHGLRAAGERIAAFLAEQVNEPQAEPVIDRG